MGNKNAESSVGTIISQLKQVVDKLDSEAKREVLSPKKRGLINADVRETMDRLNDVLRRIDPIRQPSSIFDPGNPKVVGAFIALAMVAQPRFPLKDVESYYGSGVYAIYYKGNFEAYIPISGSETPIYVGQAAPALSNARTSIDQGDRLARRLRDHYKSVSKAAGTLSVDDFEYRSLVVQSGWETAAEDYLINLFKPIWNNETDIVFGLGKHGDAATTRGNRRSPWDTLHPGRKWAENIKEDARSIERIKDDLAKHFASQRTFGSRDEVLNHFVEGLQQI